MGWSTADMMSSYELFSPPSYISIIPIYHSSWKFWSHVSFIYKWEESHSWSWGFSEYIITWGLWKWETISHNIRFIRLYVHQNKLWAKQENFHKKCKTGDKYISSSSCRAISIDIPDPLLPPLPIVHRSRQVLRATSHIYTELLYVGLSWSPCLCLTIWRDPQEYITYELIPTSPAVSHMSGLSNFDSFSDEW